MEESPGSGLQLRILGPLEAVRAGVPIDLGPRRQRAVLVRLALDLNDPVSPDRLIEDVWGGRPPDGALRTLRSYLSRLRAVLAPSEAIARRAAGYALELDPQAVDVTAFERLAAEGRALLLRRNPRAAAARLRAALGLWRGEPLAGLPLEPFVLAERSRLEERRLAALEDLFDAEFALGRQGMTVAELEALLEQYPLRERLWGHLMTALYREGRQAEALEAYQRVRRLLREELGLEPGDELRRLQQAILRHELASPEAGLRHNLPAPLTTFIGRERELDELSGRLLSQRLVTISGVGGTGKTRLAVEVARRVVDAFPDGVWMVDLAPVSEPALVAQTIAAEVGTDFGGGPATASALADHLARTDGLLLLDNCEHLLTAVAPLVEGLLVGCPALRVLATSREPLAVPGESLYQLPPLGAPPAGVRDDLARYDAVRLFIDRVGAGAAEEALDAVARICRELDGLPLAIEIAAAQTRLLPVNEVASRLADRFRLLTYWSRTAPPRHRTLRASLDWSDGLLDPSERDLFHRLAVFAGSFGLDAVEAVAGDRSDVLGRLRRLVDASLVVREQRRFRLLETIRQYAVERLSASGRTDEVAAAHAAFFTQLARQARTVANSAAEAETYERFDADLPNLRTALEWALRSDDGALLADLAAGLARYWRLRGYFDEGELWLRRALGLCGQESSAIRARLHAALGEILLVHGRGLAAREQLATAAEVARSARAPAELGNALHWLAMEARHGRRFDEARALLTEALELARAGGDTAALSHRLGSLADIAMMQGRLEEARALYDEAWQVVQPASHGHRVPYLESTARLALALGDRQEASRRAAEGLAAARELGDQQHIGLNLTILAATGGPDGPQPVEMLAEALELLWPTYRWALADVLDILAGLLLADGEFAEGVTLIAAADEQRARSPGPVPALKRPAAEKERQKALAALGDVSYQDAWSRGASMAPEEAASRARRALARRTSRAAGRRPAAPADAAQGAATAVEAL